MKFNIPTKEPVQYFTSDKIQELQDYSNPDNLKVGDFCKKVWLKAPPSLRVILRKEVSHNGNVISCTFANCNPHNGVVSNTVYHSTFYKRKYVWGDHYWEEKTVIPQTYNFNNHA